MPRLHPPGARSNARVLTLSVAVVCAAGAASGCRQSTTTDNEHAGPGLDQALKPASLARGLRALGALHLTAKTHFVVKAAGPDKADTFKEQNITTTTLVSLDADGNYRFAEENDQDGGRQVVSFGDELALQLRYGKLMRRKARDNEAQSLLAEAVGGPFAAWELLKKQARIERTEAAAGKTDGVALPAGYTLEVHRVSLQDVPESPDRAAETPPESLRSWRQTARLISSTGVIRLGRAPKGTVGDGAVVIGVSLEGAFEARQGETPVHGQFAVELAVDRIGGVDPIVLPEEAETLWVGQRTLPVENELLHDLPGRRDPADVTARR